jgi:hypothetical protein
MEIYAESELIDGSYSVGDVESLSVPTAGSYILRVYGYHGAAGDYAIQLL